METKRITKEIEAKILCAIEYNPDTGEVVWKQSPKQGIRAGAPAGRIGSDGYRRIVVYRKKISVHHIAWWLTYGSWPKNQIDHKNGIRTDNRLSNLREATLLQNRANVRPRYKSKSGFRGVSQSGGAFVARVGNEHLGKFGSGKDAAIAYDNAAIRKYGEFAVLNFPALRGADRPEE